MKNKKNNFNKYIINKIIISFKLSFFIFFNSLFFVYKVYSKNEKKIEINLINQINQYILICRNGTLLNGIKKSKKNIIITVVLTLYNSEKTIRTSVRSIQNQIFSDFEIIIIDDYSTDTGYHIIKLLQKEDKRIKIIKNKKNRGPLYSRSIGALNSKGKYIFPLDSDDLFANKNLFSLCYNEAEKYNIDILEFSALFCNNVIISINDNFPNIPLYLRYKKNNTIIRSPNLQFFIYQKIKNQRFRLIDSYLWGKSIRSQIYIKALNILGEHVYTKNLCYGEDRIVNFFLFKVADSFKFIEIYGIIYNYNRNSITNSNNIIKNCNDELINIMAIYNYIKNSKEVEISIYEIIHRWNSILYPGLKDKKNKQLITFSFCKFIVFVEYFQFEKNNLKI